MADTTSISTPDLFQAWRLDILELIDDRHGRRSTLLTSQVPIACLLGR